METKTIFVLFMSHKSGEHGLSVHNTIDELKAEIKSVVELIKENSSVGDDRQTEENYNDDLSKIDEVCDGYWAELSDSTWFDVFVREV